MPEDLINRRANIALHLTLPDHADVPATGPEPLGCGLVAHYGSPEMTKPCVRVPAGNYSTRAAVMPVPVATVDEYRQLLSIEQDIRSSGKVARVLRERQALTK